MRSLEETPWRAVFVRLALRTLIVWGAIRVVHGYVDEIPLLNFLEVMLLVTAVRAILQPNKGEVT